MRRTALIQLGIATLASAALAAAPTAHAAGIVGSGTAASCTDAALGNALAGGGLVTFDCGPDPVTIGLSPSGTGTKTIASDTTIDGGGLVTISGGHNVIVFDVLEGVTFVVENLGITLGNAIGGYGGGISGNRASIFVRNSTFTGNTAGYGGYGSAISNRSGNRPAEPRVQLTVINSTFSDNTAPQGNGGAIAALSVDGVGLNSTFSGNSSNKGGGVYFRDTRDDGTTLTISNSTFVDNSAEGEGGSGEGGGVYAENRGANVRNTIVNSTFLGNSALRLGGGIYAEGDLTIANTIVADNDGGNCGSQGSGELVDGGNNLEDGSSCGFLASQGSLNTNPLLDPAGLQDNGGPTQTIALQASSPAIDAGNATVCAAHPVYNLDQRGFVRPGTDSTTCSIGAYEYVLPAGADCCQCATSCAAPIDGSCGDCDVVFGATCRGDALCVLHTPAPTVTPTSTPTPTSTSTRTASATRTPIVPTATPTLGRSACCQCDSFCAAPINGTCGGCVAIPQAACTNDSACVPRTSPLCMGDCSDDLRVTVNEILTMVNIGLGGAGASACPIGMPVASGASSDPEVTVVEIITAVNSALNGCATD